MVFDTTLFFFATGSSLGLLRVPHVYLYSTWHPFFLFFAKSKMRVSILSPGNSDNCTPYFSFNHPDHLNTERNKDLNYHHLINPTTSKTPTPPPPTTPPNQPKQKHYEHTNTNLQPPRTWSPPPPNRSHTLHLQHHRHLHLHHRSPLPSHQHLPNPTKIRLRFS